MIVRIIQCTNYKSITPWYSLGIGEEFNVVEWVDKHPYKIPEDLEECLSELYAVDDPCSIWDSNGILKQDCIII